MPRFGYDPQVRQDVRQDMRQEVRQEVRQKVKQEVRQQTICRSRFYCVYPTHGQKGIHQIRVEIQRSDWSIKSWRAISRTSLFVA
jgi:hypothetical protein